MTPKYLDTLVEPILPYELSREWNLYNNRIESYLLLTDEGLQFTIHMPYDVSIFIGYVRQELINDCKIKSVFGSVEYQIVEDISDEIRRIESRLFKYLYAKYSVYTIIHKDEAWKVN